MQTRRGELTLKVLNMIAEEIGITASIVIGILESGYGASYRTMQRNVDKRLEGIGRSANLDEIKRERDKIYATLARLKESGCIDKIDQEWKLTKSGKTKIRQLELAITKGLPASNYHPEKSNMV